MYDDRDIRTQLRFGNRTIEECAEHTRQLGLVEPTPRPARLLVRVAGVVGALLVIPFVLALAADALGIPVGFWM